MAKLIVSVVIPAYNRENAIARAIHSVIDQGVDNIEIIVVDDCSKDGTVKAIQSIDDNRIKLIQHEKNKGEAGARNTGVKAAKGAYVAYLDSDDYWLPGKLQAQIDYMDKAPDDIGGVYTLHERLYQNGKKSIGGYSSYPLDFRKMIVKGISISPGPTFLFRKKLFDKVGDYDETAPLYVDWDWMLRFLKISKLGCIDKAYAVYEKNPAYRSGELLEKAHQIFLSKFQSDIDNLPQKDRNECMARMYLDIARGYAENESKWIALKYYMQALRLTPVMSAGSYLNIFDGLTGLNLLPHVDSWFRRTT